MPFRPLLLFAAGLLAVFSVRAAEVLQVTWPTSHAAQPLKLQTPSSGLLPAFRLALNALPESSIVPLALSQPALLGLNQKQAESLRPLTAERYRLMALSPHYAKAASALPYCFSEQRPTAGLASVYVPEGATTQSPVIVFLHGYGGSFLWYQHFLTENFPHHIIICPAYGISTAEIPQNYVAESVGAVSKQLGFPLSTPCLVGLSAGGFGACRLYVAAPYFYSQMICLAAYPTDDTLARFARDSWPRFLSGGAEPFVSSGDFQQRMTSVRRVCPAIEASTIPGADHFFLLTHPEQSVEHLRRWLLAKPPANK